MIVYVPCGVRTNFTAKKMCVAVVARTSRLSFFLPLVVRLHYLIQSITTDTTKNNNNDCPRRIVTAILGERSVIGGCAAIVVAAVFAEEQQARRRTHLLGNKLPLLGSCHRALGFVCRQCRTFNAF